MSRNKIIMVGTISCVSVITGLLLIVILIVPKLVESEMVKKWIDDELSRSVGATVDFERIDVSLFPTPHLFVVQPSAIWPDRLSVAAERVAVFPKLLPLLLGRVNITRSDIQHPELTVTIEKSRRKDDLRTHPDTIAEWLQRIATIDASQLPQLNCMIQNGRVTVVYDKETVLTYDHLKANLGFGSKEVSFTVSGNAAIAGHVELSGQFNPKDSSGQAHIQLAQVDVQSVFNALIPERRILVKNARADTRIDVEMHAPEDVRASIDISLPSLTLAHNDETLAFNGGELTGRIDFSTDGYTATLTKLALAHPRMDLSGNLQASSKDTRMAVQLEGRNIDVTETREMMLFLWGRYRCSGSIDSSAETG